MDFAKPLITATLLKRYKRFLADVTLDDGRLVTVHCPNPGAMLGLAQQGARVWLEPARNPAAKLPYRWVLEAVGGHLVGIDTGLPNTLVPESLERLAPLSGYAHMRPEVRYDQNSRIDLLLSDHPDDPRPCFVEIKNVHWRRGDLAAFPDSVTARGTKHLEALARQVAGGARAVMCYVVQRGDCTGLTLAADIDPAYARAAETARAAGVEFVAFQCAITTSRVELAGPLPIVESQRII